jgi:uncharacterized membrane protein
MGFHYFPLSLPFLLLLGGLYALLLAMVALRVLSYAYVQLGLRPGGVLAVLLLSLLGSYVNIPLFQLPAEPMVRSQEIVFAGMHYMVPVARDWPGTIVAVNVGGAVIPTLLSLYLIIRNQLYGRALVGVAVVTVVCHMLAHPVPGLGIAVPVFIPPVTAAIVAVVLARRVAGALAYVSGSLGTLIGADLLNLDKIRGLGAPVASIGGAGTFDGIFVCGLIAVLLASLVSPRQRPA